MKISLITTTFNSAKTLKSTLDSVKSQTYADIEYVIVDGGSTDGTLELIESYASIVTKSISEPDEGIYDAINKGIKLTSGDVIGLLHSDDFFASNQVLQIIADTFQEYHVDAIYGDLQYVDAQHTDKVVRNWVSQAYNPSLFYRGWMPAHPTFYLKRSCYERYGLYNTDFTISADYELMLRMLLKNEVKAMYIPKTLVQMRVGGESNASLSNRLRANREDVMAWKMNGLKPKFYARFAKPLSKLKQFF